MAITKSHGPGGLNHRNSQLAILGLDVQTKALLGSVSGQASLSGLHSDGRLLAVAPRGLSSAHAQRALASLPLSVRPPTLSDESLTLKTHVTFIPFPEALSLNAADSGLPASAYEFEEHRMQSIAHPDISAFK